MSLSLRKILSVFLTWLVLTIGFYMPSAGFAMSASGNQFSGQLILDEELATQATVQQEAAQHQKQKAAASSQKPTHFQTLLPDTKGVAQASQTPNSFQAQSLIPRAPPTLEFC